MRIIIQFRHSTKYVIELGYNTRLFINPYLITVLKIEYTTTTHQYKTGKILHQWIKHYKY